jgi:hypothetical protein
MNQHTPTMATREDGLLIEFGNLIGRHADWLDVETFLRLAQHAAEAYFGRDELEEYFRHQAQLFATGFERKQLGLMAQNTSGIDSPGPIPVHEPDDANEASP